MGDFKYTPTKLMLPTSHYDERRADFAVGFIQMLKHTTGEWFGEAVPLDAVAGNHYQGYLRRRGRRRIQAV
jgi:hypothetical protein